MTNEILREYVTRTAFNLSLGSCHIASLVYFEELRKVGWDTSMLVNHGSPKNKIQRAFGHLVTGDRGLVERGLITRKHDVGLIHKTVDGVEHLLWPTGAVKFTKAGKLVIGLLKESGLYEEYARELRLDSRTGAEVATGAGIVPPTKSEANG